MKIRTDVNDIIPQRPYVNPKNKPIVQQQKTSVSQPQIQANNDFTSSVINKLNMERSLSDALSIAQMSQNLIQKAMVISSKLKDIASQAIATGKIDSEAVTMALGGIDNTIQKYGENVVQPVQTSSSLNSHLTTLPIAVNDLNALQDVAQSMKQGSIPNQDQIVGVESRLNIHLTGTQKFQENIVTHINDAIGTYPDFPRPHMERLNAEVTNSISQNPALALRAQGNVNPQVVGNVVYGAV